MNTQYRKNLKAVLEANKQYTDNKIEDLKWELGTYDLGVDTNTDVAHIKTLPSGTIQTTVAKVEGVGYKVNQLIRNGNFVNTDYWAGFNGTITTSNNKLTLTATSTESSVMIQQTGIKIQSGHKYLVHYLFTPSRSGGTFIYYGSSSTAVATTANVVNNINIFFTASMNSNYIYSYMNNAGNQVGDTAIFENFNIFDLTADFGSGNEPSTVSDCATEYAKRGINIYEYTPQQSSIKNNAFTGVKVEGFNKWDEVVEIGSINTTTGQNEPYSTQLRSKNYINVIPNLTYYFLCGSADAYRIYEYDINNNFIKQTLKTTSGTFTLSENAYYVRFIIGDNYGTTYNNDICINVSGSANGTYVPYIQPTTISVDLTTIKDSNNVSLFPSGKLMGNSSVMDFITPYNQESRWNEKVLDGVNYIVDYSPQTTNNYFYRTTITDAKSSASTTTPINALSDGVWTATFWNNVRYGSELAYAIATPINTNEIWISFPRDSAYDSIAKVNTWLQTHPITIQYERATYLTSNTDLTSLTRINAESNGTITLNNTDNVDMPNTIKSLKEVAK